MHISLTRNNLLLVSEFIKDTNRDVLEAPLWHEQGCQICEERGQLDAVRELDPADVLRKPFEELEGCGGQMPVSEVVEDLDFRRRSLESVFFHEMAVLWGIITRVNGYEGANEEGDMQNPVALNELNTV